MVGSTSATAGERAVESPFERFMENVPSAFAVTSGITHRLVYVNAAFRQLAALPGPSLLDSSLAGAFPGRETSGLVDVLDRAFRTGVVARDRRIDPLSDDRRPWVCTIWPEPNSAGDPEYLVIELRAATETELSLALQRDVAEQLLLSALHEQDAADNAAAASRRAKFLATEGRRLGESLNENATLDAMRRMSLPSLGAWCIVDLIDEGGAMRRLAIIHRDPDKQRLLRELEGQWLPEPGDRFGLPAVLRKHEPAILADDIDGAIATAAHDPRTLRILREAGIGPMLTVPILIRNRLVGAITFVASRGDHDYTPEDVELAQDLALRSAMSLENARLHSESIALREKAEAASEAKSAFLGTMSHELRTPLNAIGGYVDLIEMGIHGPVTDAQREALGRIRNSQRHLTALISDVLNFVRIDRGRLPYNMADIVVNDVIAAAVALVEPLMARNGLAYDGLCETTIVAHADPEKVTQILVNLLSNAIKFTPRGGRVTVGCEAAAGTVLTRVTDTGVGIPPDEQDKIFDAFVQAKAGATREREGTGLGLTISRDLARGMGGDLRVRSAPGKGSVFTLSLRPAGAARQ